jgi:midasin (ATPase involved in ribosome maturation)
VPQKHDTAKFRWGQGFTPNIYHKGHKEGNKLAVDNNIDFFYKIKFMVNSRPSNKYPNKETEQNKLTRNWNKSQLFKLLYGLYHTKIPTMIWGNPGGGKTSTVKFLGKTLGQSTEIRSGNKSDPTDFSGIPYLIDVKGEEDGKTLKFSEPKYVQIMKKNPNGILFFEK